MHRGELKVGLIGSMPPIAQHFNIARSTAQQDSNEEGEFIPECMFKLS